MVPSLLTAFVSLLTIAALWSYLSVRVCTSLRRLSTSSSATEKFSNSLAASLRSAFDLSMTLIRFSFSSRDRFDFSSFLSCGADFSSPVVREPQSEIGPVPLPSEITYSWL